jgi:protein O-GlcNAc transferase
MQPIGNQPTLQHEALLKSLENNTCAILFNSLGPETILRFPFRDHEIAMYLPYGSYDLIQRRILMSASFFELRILEGIRKYIPQKPVIVDVGANIGNHLIYFGLICNAFKIIAFEPQKVAYKILERNVFLNNLSEICELHRVAVGKTTGYADISGLARSNIGGTSFESTSLSDYPMVTLDDKIQDHVDLIKIDVEGGQLDVLAGAAKLLARCRPAIICEARSGKDDTVGLADFMNGIDYAPVALDANNSLWTYRKSSTLSP